MANVLQIRSGGLWRLSSRGGNIEPPINGALPVVYRNKLYLAVVGAEQLLAVYRVRHDLQLKRLRRIPLPVAARAELSRKTLLAERITTVADIIFEPIRVADADFHITKSIDQCPPGLTTRELLRNAFEAPATPEEEGQRKVIHQGRCHRRDTQAGDFKYRTRLVTDELKSATDLASWIRKTKGLDGRKNRGEGAKVASLPWNHLGFRMRSCQKRQVSEVLVRRVDNRYVRERFAARNEEGGDTYEAVWDVTEECRDSGYDLTQDWTEVTLFGNAAQQDTVRWPYGEHLGHGDKRARL